LYGYGLYELVCELVRWCVGALVRYQSVSGHVLRLFLSVLAR
jgi:hypothetical protein